MRRRMENLILAPETRKEHGHAGQSHHPDSIGRKCDWHRFSQTAHLSNILFFVTAVNHRTSAEEQKRLKEGVRQQMEHTDEYSTHSEPHHHVAQLRDR